MAVDSTSFISVPSRTIAEFSDTGPESLDHATPVLRRTRRSTLYIVISFSADPGAYSLGIAASLDAINFYELDTITGVDGTKILKKYENFNGSFIQPFQNSKTNDVVVSFEAKLV